MADEFDWGEGPMLGYKVERVQTQGNGRERTFRAALLGLVEASQSNDWEQEARIWAWCPPGSKACLATWFNAMSLKRPYECAGKIGYNLQEADLHHLLAGFDGVECVDDGNGRWSYYEGERLVLAVEQCMFAPANYRQLDSDEAPPRKPQGRPTKDRMTIPSPTRPDVSLAETGEPDMVEVLGEDLPPAGLAAPRSNTYCPSCKAHSIAPTELSLPHGSECRVCGKHGLKVWPCGTEEPRDPDYVSKHCVQCDKPAVVCGGSGKRQRIWCIPCAEEYGTRLKRWAPLVQGDRAAEHWCLSRVRGVRS